MKLIQDIINELVNAQLPIDGPLLKTKVLASKLQNDTLYVWADREISGYILTEIPEYRRYQVSLVGTFDGGGNRHTNSTIPTEGLSDKIIESLTNIAFPQSVTSLASLKINSSSGQLIYQLPAEMVGLLEDNWQKFSPFITLHSASRLCSVIVIDEILTNVRNRLLDFMLKLDHEFGSQAEIDELKEKTEQVNHFLHQTIIITGSGNTMNTGSQSSIALGDNR